MADAFERILIHFSIIQQVSSDSDMGSITNLSFGLYAGVYLSVRQLCNRQVKSNKPEAVWGLDSVAASNY
jgi:hypothetical protein